MTSPEKELMIKIDTDIQKWVNERPKTRGVLIITIAEHEVNQPDTNNTVKSQIQAFNIPFAEARSLLLAYYIAAVAATTPTNAEEIYSTLASNAAKA